MIKWIDINTGSDFNGDVSIAFAGKRDKIRIRISSGAMATKFKHRPRILLGADSKAGKFYMVGDESEGYKPQLNKSGSGYIAVRVEKLEEIMGNTRVAELIGDYDLKYDKENEAYFFGIGALSR